MAARHSQEVATRDWGPLLKALLYPLPVWAAFAFFIYVTWTYRSYMGWGPLAFCIVIPLFLIGAITVDCWPDR